MAQCSLAPIIGPSCPSCLSVLPVMLHVLPLHVLHALELPGAGIRGLGIWDAPPHCLHIAGAGPCIAFLGQLQHLPLGLQQVGVRHQGAPCSGCAVLWLSVPYIPRNDGLSSLCWGTRLLRPAKSWFCYCQETSHVSFLPYTEQPLRHRS